jgi:uncharacterized membrane protein
MKFNAGILHLLATLSFLGLFLLLMLWNTVLAPSDQLPKALALLIAITPLLLPMRGFLQGRPKSCGWMSYVSLIYLIHGTAEAYAVSATRLLSLLEIALSLTLFFSSAFYLRIYKLEHARTVTD